MTGRSGGVQTDVSVGRAVVLPGFSGICVDIYVCGDKSSAITGDLNSSKKGAFVGGE